MVGTGWISDLGSALSRRVAGSARCRSMSALPVALAVYAIVRWLASGLADTGLLSPRRRRVIDVLAKWLGGVAQGCSVLNKLISLLSGLRGLEDPRGVASGLFFYKSGSSYYTRHVPGLTVAVIEN